VPLSEAATPLSFQGEDKGEGKIEENNRHRLKRRFGTSDRRSDQHRAVSGEELQKRRVTTSGGSFVCRAGLVIASGGELVVPLSCAVSATRRATLP